MYTNHVTSSVKVSHQAGVIDPQNESFYQVLAFTEGAVKKVFGSLEMCWHLLKELLKKGWQRHGLAFP